MRVVIIGNGIAGTTAARYVRKGSDAAITMISGEAAHPYARTALMYVFMGHVRYRDTKLYEDGFWPRNRIDLVRAHVVGIDAARREVRLGDGRVLPYDRLLIATGSTPRTGGWPGCDLGGVHPLHGIADVERLDAEVGDGSGLRRAVVVGGGLTGVELTEMLHTRGVPVTFLVRGERFMAATLPAEESARVAAEIRRHGIDLRVGEEVERFEGATRVEAVVTRRGERLAADLAGVTIGVRPDLSALHGSGIETNRGVLVDACLRTSAPDVFAAGDCAQWRDAATGHAPVEQLWYSARRQGYYAARNLLGTPTPYERGVFFNSAKFYTLEWQTYGHVPAAPTPGRASVVWHRGDRFLRLVYDTRTLALAGVSVLGVRYRAEVCRAWIARQAPLAEVVAALPHANFDPEFHARPEAAFQKAFAGAQGRLGQAETLSLA